MDADEGDVYLNRPPAPGAAPEGCSPEARPLWCERRLSRRRCGGWAAAGDCRSWSAWAEPHLEATVQVWVGIRVFVSGVKRKSKRTDGLSRAAEWSGGAVAEAGPLQDFADQAETVAVDTRGGHSQQQVPLGDVPQSGQQGAALHRAHAEPGQVVLAGSVDARHLCRLTSWTRTFFLNTDIVSVDYRWVMAPSLLSPSKAQPAIWQALAMPPTTEAATSTSKLPQEK